MSKKSTVTFCTKSAILDRITEFLLYWQTIFKSPTCIIIFSRWYVVWKPINNSFHQYLKKKPFKKKNSSSYIKCQSCHLSSAALILLLFVWGKNKNHTHSHNKIAFLWVISNWSSLLVLFSESVLNISSKTKLHMSVF